MVSSTTAAATAGVNSGNALAAIVNWSGSLTSSQARKNRINLSRACGEARTRSKVARASSGVPRYASGVADESPIASGGPSASV